MPGRTGSGHRRERLERRAAIDDPQVVLAAAARYLEVRSRSVEEMRRHLSGAGYRSELVELAIARLTELGMLDDRAFAQTWIESRDRARPRGEQALRRELAQKGLNRELIAEVLAERAGENEADDGGFGSPAVVEPGADVRAAEKLLVRRGAALARIADPRRRRGRAYALLARNGFGPEICREVSARFVAPGTADADAAEPAGNEEP
ncbi:MAG: regulatory protein RecX [Candidatus Limnocylindrales bacterium]